MCFHLLFGNCYINGYNEVILFSQHVCNNEQSHKSQILGLYTQLQTIILNTIPLVYTIPHYCLAILLSMHCAIWYTISNYIWICTHAVMRLMALVAEVSCNSIFLPGEITKLNHSALNHSKSFSTKLKINPLQHCQWSRITHAG